MFTDRHVIEGSIEHQVSLMTRAKRLAKAEESSAANSFCYC
jgi:hypothetical protein